MSQKSKPSSAFVRTKAEALARDVLDSRMDALRGALVFSGWPDRALMLLAEKSRMESLAAHVPIQAVGQVLHSVHVLVSGATQSGVTDREGRRVSLKLHKPGEVHGLFLWASGTREQRHDLVTLMPSTLLVIPIDVLHEALAAYPHLWQSVATETARRLLDALEIALSFGLESPRTRFARHIIRQVESAETGAGDSPRQVPMSQQVMAELLGVSRPTVASLVRSFEAQGLIRWHYGRISILDMEKLLEAAQWVWRREPPRAEETDGHAGAR